MKFFCALGLAVLLSGCHHVVLKERFNPQEAAYILRAGTGCIEGETFWRTRRGRIVKGAGERVYLVPATAYARSRFDKIFRGQSSMPSYYAPTLESDPISEKLYNRYTRSVIVDSRGYFIFERVAPGSYFIAVTHEFDEDVRFKFLSLSFSEGGIAYERVTVRPRSTVKVIVSGKGSFF